MRFGELIDEVISTLSGYTTDVPQAGTLTADITATSLELRLDFGEFARPGGQFGVLEIDRELIEVSRYDPSTQTAHLAPWSRGVRNTTAVSHKAGARVTMRPRWPRKQVGDVINQVVAASCPPLYAVRNLDPIEIDVVGEMGYDLPADTVRVLRLEATSGVGTHAEREVVRNWSVRGVAGTRQLQLHDRFELPWSTLLATVVVDPGRMTDEGNDFVDKTGLPESCTDLVVFGALGRLVLSGEAARLTNLPPDASQRAEKTPTGSGTALARYFQALYTQRLEQEQARLQHTYPLQLLRRG